MKTHLLKSTVNSFAKKPYLFNFSNNSLFTKINYSAYYKNSIKSFSFEQQKDKNKRHFMLLYRYVEDMHYKRVPFKEEHLKLIESYENQKHAILGGSFFPNDGALLLFTGNDELIVDEFVKKDPYYKNGLVIDYEIKELELHTKKRADELALYYKYR